MCPPTVTLLCRFPSTGRGQRAQIPRPSGSGAQIESSGQLKVWVVSKGGHAPQLPIPRFVSGICFLSAPGCPPHHRTTIRTAHGWGRMLHDWGPKPSICLGWGAVEVAWERLEGSREGTVAETAPRLQRRGTKQRPKEISLLVFARNGAGLLARRVCFPGCGHLRIVRQISHKHLSSHPTTAVNHRPAKASAEQSATIVGHPRWIPRRDPVRALRHDFLVISAVHRHPACVGAVWRHLQMPRGLGSLVQQEATLRGQCVRVTFDMHRNLHLRIFCTTCSNCIQQPSVVTNSFSPAWQKSMTSNHFVLDWTGLSSTCT